MYELRNIKYKDILTIDHLQLEEGKVSCITGKSGTGKSSLLKLLNSIYVPDSGEITYYGSPLSEIDPIKLRREAVMLAQAPLIFPGTIEENLQAGLKFAEKELASAQKLHQVIERMELSKDLGENAEELSGGEKQRIALARVLLMRARVYLLDEPTSGLDENTEIKVLRSFIDESRKNKSTVLMITHSIAAAETFADREISLDT